MNEAFLLVWLPAIAVVAALWTIPWKGYALWKAARRGDKVWFVVLLVVNTLGILEILYIFVFSKDKNISGTTNDNLEKDLDNK